VLRRAQILPSSRQVRPHPGSHFPDSPVFHPAPPFPTLVLLVVFSPVFRRPTVGVASRLRPPRPTGAVYRRRPRSRPRSRQSVSTTARDDADASFVAAARRSRTRTGARVLESTFLAVTRVARSRRSVPTRGGIGSASRFPPVRLDVVVRLLNSKAKFFERGLMFRVSRVTESRVTTRRNQRRGGVSCQNVYVHTVITWNKDKRWYRARGRGRSTRSVPWR